MGRIFADNVNRKWTDHAPFYEQYIELHLYFGDRGAFELVSSSQREHVHVSRTIVDTSPIWSTLELNNSHFVDDCLTLGVISNHCSCGEYHRHVLDRCFLSEPKHGDDRAKFRNLDVPVPATHVFVPGLPVHHSLGPVVQFRA